MSKAKKHQLVSDLEQIYKSNNSVIVTHYHGLTVSKVIELRSALRKAGAGFLVTKNTLSKIAANNVGFGLVNQMFSGPTAIVYSSEPASATKIVVEFAKKNESLKILGGVINTELFSEQQIVQLSKLPSLAALRATIAGIVQAPAVKLAGIIQAPAVKSARVISLRSEQEI